MTHFVVDSGAAIRLLRENVAVAPRHELLAPTLLRSQVLGDAVLQKVAWEVADRLGWDETYDAEYIALTKLEADGAPVAAAGTPSRT